jgi:hypothetical protein
VEGGGMVTGGQVG